MRTQENRKEKTHSIMVAVSLSSTLNIQDKKINVHVFLYFCVYRELDIGKHVAELTSDRGNHAVGDNVPLVKVCICC